MPPPLMPWKLKIHHRMLLHGRPSQGRLPPLIQPYFFLQGFIGMEIFTFTPSLVLLLDFSAGRLHVRFQSTQQQLPATILTIVTELHPPNTTLSQPWFMSWVMLSDLDPLSIRLINLKSPLQLDSSQLIFWDSMLQAKQILPIVSDNTTQMWLIITFLTLPSRTVLNFQEDTRLQTTKRAIGIIWIWLVWLVWWILLCTMDNKSEYPPTIWLHLELLDGTSEIRWSLCWTHIPSAQGLPPSKSWVTWLPRTLNVVSMGWQLLHLPILWRQIIGEELLVLSLVV